MDSLIEVNKCWCGSRKLEPFSKNYIRCNHCLTLISSPRKPDEFYNVQNDDFDFYGKDYWLNHQNELGFPDIIKRSREDLSERCVYWLKTILSHKMPCGKSLELGCSHGALVALMKFTGFEARGLELSNWVVQYATKTFGIPVFCGKIEELNIEPNSLDCIVMIDVLEHLTTPLETLNLVAKSLKRDGILVIQTPCYRDIESTYEQMVDKQDVFLQMMKEKEHLYLFTVNGLKILLNKIGLNLMIEEKPLFPYDMFVFASKSPIPTYDEKALVSNLVSTVQGRITLALFDLYQKWEISEKDRAARLEAINNLNKVLQESESDREARLAVINELNTRLIESESDRAARLAVINELNTRLIESESDREARLTVINELNPRLIESESDRAARLGVINELSARLVESESDRAARLAVINELNPRLIESERDREARLAVINELNTRLIESKSDSEARLALINDLNTRLAASESDREARLQIIENLSRKLAENEKDRLARLEIIHELNERLDSLQNILQENEKIKECLTKQLNEFKNNKLAVLAHKFGRV